MKPFHEKLHIIAKNFISIFIKMKFYVTPVNNKMALDPTPDEIKDFKKFEKVLVSKRTLRKKHFKKLEKIFVSKRILFKKKSNNARKR